MNYPLPNCGFHSIYQQFSAVYLQQTTRCPNNCIFCAYIKQHRKFPSRKNHGDMSMADLEYVLKTIPGFRGFVSLGMSGEGMLLDTMPERIRLIKRHWPECRCGLTTTFNVYRGGEYLEELFESGLDCLDISCYAHTDDDYRKIHGSKSFAGLIKNLGALKNIKKDYLQRVRLMFLNDMETLYGVADAENKRVAFENVARGYGIERFSYHDYFPWEQPVQPDGHALWSLPSPCSVVWGERAGILNIHANLDVVPCCMFTGDDFILGNLRELSLEDIFNSSNWHFFYESWWKMQPGNIPVCNLCQIYSDNSRPEELGRLAAWQADQIAGKKVVFYGCGESYRMYRSYFNRSEPVAIIHDDAGSMPPAIDGIPVKSPHILTESEGKLPLVIFAAPAASATILKRLKSTFPDYSPEKLIICPANAHIKPDLSRLD